MVKLWVVAAGSFLAGILVGALTYAAAERHVRAEAAAATQTAGAASLAAQSGAPGGVTRVEVAPREAAKSELSDERDRRESVDNSLRVLDERLSALEVRLADSASAGPGEADVYSLTPASGGMDQETLVAAGVNPAAAADILRRRNQLEMQRLELRDRATREGWIGSERFLEELRQLEGDVGALRAEIGDDAFDRFLYLTGQPNRITIASVIDESPAQLAGLEAGDRVIGYADDRIFSYADLRNATRAGVRGEYVVVRVQREDEILELTLPRGPLGIRLDSDRIDPDAEG